MKVGIESLFYKK